MVVYKYDEEGYYSGEHKCQIDPVKGGYLFPARYIKTKPPEVADQNELIKIDGESWEIESTELSKPMWDTSTGEKSICREKEIPEGFTSAEKPAEDYYVWDGSIWEIDSGLKKEHDIALLIYELALTDTDIPRGIEDLMDTLDEQNVLKKDKTPQDFQDKLANKKLKRAELEALLNG